MRYKICIKYNDSVKKNLLFGEWDEVIECKNIIEVNGWIALLDNTVKRAIYVDNVTTKIITIK